MAGNIKGITIEFRGDTTRLDKALRQVEQETRALDRELKGIDRALKFNPTSVDLWRQKQQVLTQKIKESEDKLQLLKQQQRDMDARGVDKNSAEYRKLQREIIETESKLKTFKAQLRAVGNVKLQALGQQFKQIGDKMMRAGRTLTTYVTTPLAAVGAIGVKKFAEVDKTMQLANKTMGNTAEEAELLDTAMKSAASNSTYGMSEAATATLNYARAGLTAKESAAALAPAMNLAAGEGGELDTVSAGLVATINGFSDSFDNASSYADVFANACNNTALDVDSLSRSMSVAAPVFAAAGYTVNDAALYMGVMADKGITANKAATALKTGMARLTAPAKEGAAWMEKLGINITNADGSLKDSVTVQKELHAAFSGLSESEQLAAASAIFGKNQMDKWLALIRTSPDDVAALNKQLAETGTTESMAAAMMKGFGGSLEKLKSSLDVAATSLGQALAPVILKVAQGIQKLVDWFNQLSPRMQTVVATIGLVVAAIGPLLMIGGALISGIGTVLTSVGRFISIGTKVIQVIGLIVTAIGPVGLIFLGVAAAIMAAALLIYKNWDKIKAKAIEIKDKITQAWKQIKTNTINQVNAMKSSVTAAFNGIKARVTSIWNSIKTAITHPIQTAVGIVRSAIAKIKSILSGSISLPHIKLPHFSISGKFSLNPPSIPHIGVSWYDKGGIFDSPTIIGVGEKRPEFVGALDDLRDIVREESGGTNNFYFTVNVSGADNPEEWGRRLARQIKLEMRAT